MAVAKDGFFRVCAVGVLAFWMVVIRGHIRVRESPCRFNPPKREPAKRSGLTNPVSCGSGMEER